MRTSKKSRFFLANSFGFPERAIGGLGALGYLPLKAELRFRSALIFIRKQIFELIFLLSGSPLHLAELLLSIRTDVLEGRGEEVDDGGDVVIGGGEVLLVWLEGALWLMVGVLGLCGEF